MYTRKQKIWMAKYAIKNGVEPAAKKYYEKYYKGHKNQKRRYSLAAKGIRRKIKEWIKTYNLGDMKKLDRKPGAGRPKKPVPIKEIWVQLTEEQRYSIFERKIEEDREKSKKEKMKEQDSFENKISQAMRARIWNLSREGIRLFNQRNKTYKVLNKTSLTKNAIVQISFDHAEIVDGEVNYRKGRKYIANELKTLYSIELSDRMVGNYMNDMGIYVNVRKPNVIRKTKEAKNTKVNIENRLNQNYDRDMTISADVKYIEHVSSEGNHVYLEPIVELRSKYILAWDLDYHQGVEQIMRNLSNVDLSVVDMFNSDHGSQYVSNAIQGMLIANGIVQSCSRVGVSLDNRPSEHWFGILQTECLNFHDLSKYTFEQLKKVISDFIIYYNTKRKQEKLGWLTPEQFRNQYPSLHANF